ncbi:FHA domain-containing protein [Roseobacter ponti]|uniref:FHA domain-containing protein n=1 Tax=Roseobacter ponti TaxID=1891787 RepID=A0A858STY8_9RHOB|nr:FHA domain-containing protein [Roseobacter ponti]QJF51163.1 FHA domain-containing protein [Roseobacter ponti]
MKFIRDIINEKRHSAQAEKPPADDALLEPQDAQSDALDLGAYLQAPATAETPLPPIADLDALEREFDGDDYAGEDFADEDFDDDGYADDGYADDGYEEDDLNADTTAEQEQSPDPMDALFAQKVAPGDEAASDDDQDEVYEDDAAGFFAGAPTASDETEEEADAFEEDAPEAAADTTTASIAELRRAMAAERTAPRHEVSAEMSVAQAVSGAPVQMPAPAPGRGSSRSGRVKTRLLGFTPGTAESTDPMARAEKAGQSEFAVGWVVVIEGPGRGASFTLYDGVSKVGRGTTQAVSLNFGDNSISRENHVSIAYDGELNQFFIGHSGKANLVRVNNKPLLSTEEIRNGDTIRVGETTLRLIALCGEDFSWDKPAEKDAKYA